MAVEPCRSRLFDGDCRRRDKAHGIRPSITDWKPLSGIIPPLGEASWQAEFGLKEFPGVAELFPDMDLNGFKFIFFFEWTHRLGRLIGAATLLPLVYFWMKGLSAPWLQAKASWRPSYWELCRALSAGGWSNPGSRPGRSRARAPAIHLLLASLTFAALVWLAASLNGPDAKSRHRNCPPVVCGRHRPARAAAVGLGALVAGLRAGRAFNTWPLIDGYFWPPLDKLFLISPLWANFLDSNSSTG